ncbi:unnamed protein product [Ostreobium quekettii]|uniref:BTB domain-containing protein n=1 Tax=Ostreobium quekettii TaxID=121088 RepID=A0A8S1J178_9CHLO|nr:unnamed protein product [Ostreobium quekettii]
MLLYGDNGDCEQSKENAGTVYSFSFKTKEWSEVRTTGDCPPPDDVVELAERGGKLYVLCINYGGSCNLMAIYCLALEGKTRKWTKVKTTGTPPCGRIGCSATVLGDSWYVHGGFPRTQRHPACWDIVGDTYEYNFKSQGWSKICPVRDGLLPRGGHVAIAWRDAVVFMGGTTSSGRTEQVAYLGGGAYCTTVEVLWKCPLRPNASNGEYVFTDTIRGIRSLHGCEETSDVVLISGGTEIKAHRAILSAASKTFHRMFSGNFSEMRENKSGEVHLDSISPSVLETMIAYVYGVLKEVPANLALDLFRVGDLYCIDGLKEEALSQLKSTMSVACVAMLARVADEHSCEGLFNAAVEFVASDPDNLLQVLSSENYLSMLRETPELGQKFTHMCTRRAFGAGEHSETLNGPAGLGDISGK